MWEGRQHGVQNAKRAKGKVMPAHHAKKPTNSLSNHPPPEWHTTTPQQPVCRPKPEPSTCSPPCPALSNCTYHHHNVLPLGREGRSSSLFSSQKVAAKPCKNKVQTWGGWGKVEPCLVKKMRWWGIDGVRVPVPVPVFFLFLLLLLLPLSVQLSGTRHSMQHATCEREYGGEKW